MSERTGWEQEHDDDMPDHADAFALLDDGEIRASRCPHCCNFICTCDDHSDLMREARARYRNMEYGERPKRFGR